MSVSRHSFARKAVLALGCAGLLYSLPASAFVACSSSRDCWKTGTKVKWPGVTILFHDDSWWDEHKDDHSYRLHDASTEHDWKRGYWADGEWQGE